MTAQGAVGFMDGTLRGRDTCGGWVVTAAGQRAFSARREQ